MNNSNPISAVVELNKKIDTIIDTVMQSKEDEVLESFFSCMITDKNVSKSDVSSKMNEFILKESFDALLPIKTDYDKVLKPISGNNKLTLEEAVFIVTVIAQRYTVEYDNTWFNMSEKDRSLWVDASCFINELYFSSPENAGKVMNATSGMSIKISRSTFN